MKGDLLVFTRPDKTEVVFLHWFEKPGNVHYFRVQKGTEKDVPFAKRFAEFFGMQIGDLDEYANVNPTILVCTNDTYCYIFPYRMDEFLRAEDVTLRRRTVR